MIRETIEITTHVIEVLAIAVILIAVVHGTVRYLLHLRQARADAFERYKIQIGRAMLLALELLVAADIVDTVALDKTLEGVMLLALLVLVRTFLSWSLVVEIEGRWPWRRRDGDA